MNGKADSIPFLDLVTPHEELKEELCKVFRAALGTAGFVGGPMVEEFECDFAKFCDTRYCVGVANGTDALKCALIAAGVRQGDVVVTVPNTFIATAEAISQTGAQPEFVDIDERTHNLDVLKLQEYFEAGCHIDDHSGKPISRRTQRPVTAIIPVHLYGQTVDMDPILELAATYGVIVIEDACQAHGAEYFSAQGERWRKAGSMGAAAAFSFYPGKNLGACGEAGAVTTNDARIAEKIRMLRDHGQRQKYHHDIQGYNGRLDAIQAGILRIKLARLSAWNEQRRDCARRYNELFTESPDVETPYEPTWSKAVYHLYVVRLADRAEVQRTLAAAGIGTGIHYPVPLHLQKAYQDLGHKPGDFPVAERMAGKLLSLPMFPGLTSEQQSCVAERVLACIQREPVRALAAGADGR